MHVPSIGMPFEPILDSVAQEALLSALSFDAAGLIPVIAQDATTQHVLMFAYMNAESFRLSLQKGYAVYWSRSRQKLWHKGEESGHQQKIMQLSIDCDADVVLLQVEQVGGIACHTGRQSCFYQALDSHTQQWAITDPVIKDPDTIYHK